MIAHADIHKLVIEQMIAAAALGLMHAIQRKRVDTSLRWVVVTVGMPVQRTVGIRYVLGAPVAGARVEIWQANAHGRYSHPYDSNPAPLDPNFEGYAVQMTDSEGRYRFKTIKPGAYPVTEDWSRPPHIHFDVSGRVGRMVSQMYFENEPLNEVDPLLLESGGPEQLIASYQPLAAAGA